MNGTIKAPVLVLDATGNIGRAVVRAAIEAERPVIAVSLDYPALERLRTDHPGTELTLLPGSFADDGSSAALAADLRELGRPLAGVIVATCCEPARGRVLEQGSEALALALDLELLPQLAAARALVPLLAEAGRNGSYVVIGGPGGEQPWAGYGHRSIAAAATRMLLRVLHDEARALSVRVQLLAVEMPARTDDNDERACAHWPSALAIGARALALIDQGETREPAEAVVRFAWHAAPPLPDRRSVHARRSTVPGPVAGAFSATSRAAMHDAGPPIDTTAQRALDDTWSLLKPLLSPNNKKA
ncbi:MAG: SDR family oxidoreductase [Arenimonas sp.]|jgi:NAD(P)-dependent dehydrogenase (short-subunit alcohol dehydrogenase family)